MPSKVGNHTHGRALEASPCVPRSAIILPRHVYASALLRQPANPAEVSILLSTQAPGGGFYTGYDSGLSHEGTSTNTETTSLAILALNAVTGG